ncbi:MAG: adenosine deaminase family protein [Deltaproteobacteria bacterium]|nr:adenosine deaminase family protein [Deltaproteobacteria bacterium]
MKLPDSLNIEFIRAIPKTDLHVHLDGSLRLETLIELAKAQSVELPSYNPEGLKELVFKDRYADLGEYLHGFQYTCAVLREPEALERVAYELAIDSFAEGVRYIEPRFAPQLNASEKLSIEEVLLAVDRGLAKAKSEINQRDPIASGKEPPFDYGIIGCAMRKFGKTFSPYYNTFIGCHRYAPVSQVFPLASMELVQALIGTRDRRGVPVVGFDLAGEEKGWPANAHRKAFEYAHQHFLMKTIHAGEAYGPSSIFQAITQCHADRIGHGTHLFASDLVEHIPSSERESYTEALVQYIADRRITIEVCPTSNLQTIPSIGEIANHPVKRMLSERLSVTICTDNRLVSGTTVTEEILKIVTAFQVTPDILRDMIIYGFKRSFSPLPYVQKRAYVRRVIDYYQKIEGEFGITSPNSSLYKKSLPLG